MSKVTRGTIVRPNPELGHPCAVIATAEGQHTVEEMRVFIATHSPDPAPLKTGDRVEQKYLLGYEETKWEQTAARRTREGERDNG